MYFNNQRTYDESLHEKYNPDNWLKKQKETKQEKQEELNKVSMIEYKEPLIKRIINKIKDFFGKV